jgi:carbon storage regulator
MLVLARRQDESLVIGDDIKITVLNICKNQIKLGIEAPEDVIINRDEVYKKDQVGNVLSSNSG